jgi:DNA-binding IclR family transcriptional regulator
MTVTTATAEAAVLTRLLDEHPRRLSLRDLSREVADVLDEPTVERAIDNLTAARFLRLEGSSVVPNPAVVRFDRNHPARPQHFAHHFGTQF